MSPETNTPTEIEIPVQMNRPLSRLERLRDRNDRRFRFVVPYTTEPGFVKYRSHDLSEEVKGYLQRQATPCCYKCGGSGIKDWRAQGTKARVCKCVQNNQNKTEPVVYY